jgi:hypothetical protein
MVLCAFAHITRVETRGLRSNLTQWLPIKRAETLRGLRPAVGQLFSAKVTGSGSIERANQRHGSMSQF